MRRPTLIFCCQDGEAHGSGRSIEAFHLLEALESCAELFTKFGGHAHAVGCALPVERIPELRARLDAYARQRLTPEDFVPMLYYDAEIMLEDVNHDFWLSLQKLEPFGSGNPGPVFIVKGAKLVQPARVMKEKHVKLRVVYGEEFPVTVTSSAPTMCWAGAWPSERRRSRCCWAIFSILRSLWTTTSIPTSAECSSTS